MIVCVRGGVIYSIASSSMCNCGCKKEWVEEGQGCVIGGGIFQHQSLECTNYWSPTDTQKHRPECHICNESTFDCVTNLTTKIAGDDSEYIMDVFEEFHGRMLQQRQPYMAHLWLHTNHVPHPAMPQFYFAYNDTYGKPAGDYLGTLTQMDAQIGRLLDLVANDTTDTLIFFTADNGSGCVVFFVGLTSEAGEG